MKERVCGGQTRVFLSKMPGGLCFERMTPLGSGEKGRALLVRDENGEDNAEDEKVKIEELVP